MWVFLFVFFKIERAPGCLYEMRWISKIEKFEKISFLFFILYQIVYETLFSDILNLDKKKNELKIFSKKLQLGEIQTI